MFGLFNKDDLFSYSEGFQKIVFTKDHYFKKRDLPVNDYGLIGSGSGNYSIHGLYDFLEYWAFSDERNKYTGKRLPEKFIDFVYNVVHETYGEAAPTREQVGEDLEPMFKEYGADTILTLEEYQREMSEHPGTEGCWQPKRMYQKSTIPSSLANNWTNIKLLFDKYITKEMSEGEALEILRKEARAKILRAGVQNNIKEYLKD